jgi:hypothetical protein
MPIAPAVTLAKKPHAPAARRLVEQVKPAAPAQQVLEMAAATEGRT